MSAKRNRVSEKSGNESCDYPSRWGGGRCDGDTPARVPAGIVPAPSSRVDLPDSRRKTKSFAHRKRNFGEGGRDWGGCGRAGNGIVSASKSTPPPKSRERRTGCRAALSFGIPGRAAGFNKAVYYKRGINPARKRLPLMSSHLYRLSKS